LPAIRGRDFVIPDDVKELALPVLRHRVVLPTRSRSRGPHKWIESSTSVIDAQVVPALAGAKERDAPTERPQRNHDHSLNGSFSPLRSRLSVA